MSYELNIKERGISSYNWSSEKGAISSDELTEIKEQQTNTCGALNALPTPFARFFVCREAYRKVLAELNAKVTGKNDVKAGDAYNRIVSDSLDIMEMLYNLKYHENHWPETRKIKIREWDFNKDLDTLQESVPILAESIKDYFPSDLGSSSNRLFFIVLEEDGKEYLLGTSSPMTGFITPPDLDKIVDSKSGKVSYVGSSYENMPLLERKSAGLYFRDIRLFDKRDKDFMNYLFNQVNNGKLGDELKVFRDYIKAFADNQNITNNWKSNTEEIRSDNSNVVNVNGLEFRKDAGLSTINFFSDSLIRLPYKISAEDYKTITIIGDDANRDYDYVLPIRPKALPLLEPDFECSAQNMRGTVHIVLTNGGNTYEKDYEPVADAGDDDPRIYDLNASKVNFDIACFPNILSNNEDENGYFKVMVALADNDEDARIVDIKNINLDFYSTNDSGRFTRIDEADEDSNYGVKPAVIRSKQDDNNCKCGTKFFELYKTTFDAIGLYLKMGSRVLEGAFIKKWQTATQTSDSYTYAIDLGTSNTYISSCKNGSSNQPIQLVMKEPMVSYLHDHTGKANKSLAANIESTIFESGRKRFITEFVPPCIDGKLYGFPIRTAICRPSDLAAKPKLFDNHNIAFFYEKKQEAGKQSVITDIKWEDGDGSMLRLFIKELLLIIKSDILHHNANLSLTKLIWFRPLSFMGTTRDLFELIWKEEAKDILGLSSSRIKCYSESEAPYYYFEKGREFDSINAVSIVDIGGGSTDYVYFEDSKPIIANSVHFGCDILWGNGFKDFGDVKENGIYKKYESTINFGDEELDNINSSMKSNSNTSSKDIINFWISNAKKCEINSLLAKEYKYLFVYHFAAVVYYMANMYNARGLKCPRVIVFSGNGSRYIDNYITSNQEIITTMVTSIFEKVYGNIERIQVLMPDERKESTCYGGLYRSETAESPEEYIFQGIDNTQYKNINDLSKNLNQHALIEKVEELNLIYKSLLSDLANKQIMPKMDVEVVFKKIQEGIKDTLETAIKQEVIKKYNADDLYHDSVFFLPIIKNIFNLTLL